MKRQIAASEMPVSQWSGGRTTQIAIYPHGADYAAREFIFRISTAQVELEESEFTPLPDYDRLIASISGTMELTHGGGEPVRVEPLSTVYAFDGGVDTHCVGKARDLNLMLRKGGAEGTLELLKDGDVRHLELGENEIALVYHIAAGDALYMEDGCFEICARGDAALFRVKLKSEG